jgi:hypothetical protein
MPLTLLIPHEGSDISVPAKVPMLSSMHAFIPPQVTIFMTGPDSPAGKTENQSLCRYGPCKRPICNRTATEPLEQPASFTEKLLR